MVDYIVFPSDIKNQMTTAPLLSIMTCNERLCELFRNIVFATLFVNRAIQDSDQSTLGIGISKYVEAIADVESALQSAQRHFSGLTS
jgi:hypothetical protein